MFSNLLEKEPPKNWKNQTFGRAQDDEDQNDTDVLKPKYRRINLRKFSEKSGQSEKDPGTLDRKMTDKFLNVFLDDLILDLLPSTERLVSSIRDHTSKVWDFTFSIVL